MKVNLTHSFFSGIFWTFFQTAGSKVITLVTQLILAWLLIPSDFGKVSIATSLTSIVFLIQALGLTDVLVSRGHMYFKIIDLAKSLAFVTSIICLVFTIITAFLAGLVYDDSTITYLILIFSVCVPFNAMTVVADAKLRIDLKFKQLSLLKLGELILTSILIVAFVLFKLGVYSFIVAPVLVSVLRYIVIHKLAGVNFLFSWNLNHYKYLLSNSLWGFLHNLFQTIIRQSDYLIIGFFVSSQAVGIYFMGYSLSVQVIAILVGSLSPVFFPILKSIPKNEVKTLKNIILKIISVFSLLGMPFAILQAALAEPLIKIFLDEKWVTSIEIIQILSIGIGFNVAATIWAVALRLQDAFKKQAILSFQAAVAFVIAITLATYYFGIVGTAYAVSLYQVLISIFYLKISLKYFQIDFIQILILILKYFFSSLIIFLSFYIMTEFFSLNNWLSILTKGLAPLLFYFFVVYFFDSHSKNLIIFLFSKIKQQI